MLRVVLLLLIYFVPRNMVAQNQMMPYPPPNSSTLITASATETCGTDMLLDKLRKNIKFRVKEDKMNNDIIKISGSVTDSSFILPVVFHIISLNPSATSDLTIINAVNDLNDAFSKNGVYAASAGADTKISFCLAQTDPDGGITTGITRTTSYFSTNLNPFIEDDKLKNLVQWDPSKYINIWVVSSMNGEISAQFQCGKWSRLSEGGYATMPPNGGALDGIVVTGFGILLAHEMGHYLGLYHTFEGMNCANYNCSVDGDKVCDTPPDKSVQNSISCSSPENSCNTDTLSSYSNGFFTTDVPDLIADFMDYGNGGCHNEFTEGQAQRMRAAIITQRVGLLQNECSKPCTDNIISNFTRDLPYPTIGDMVNFTNTATGASSYEWSVDNVVVSTSLNFSYTFNTAGKFKVMLKAFNSSFCYATYTDYVIVTCGVSARFYSNKRIIASKYPIYTDSIYFTNTSINATSYQWVLSNDKGMAAQVVATSKDLNYVFVIPANYVLQLIATNGGCSDTSEAYTIPVADPTQDGVLYIYSANCYQQTKLKVMLYVCNYGYATIPAGTPISFYDADPRLGNAHVLAPSFLLPAAIPGLCCGYLYTYIIDVKQPYFNQLYAVFNDSGTTSPLQLPNTPLLETNYANNIQVVNNLAFKVTASPMLATLEPGDTLQLKAVALPGAVSSYIWNPSYNLSCKICQATNLIADTTSTKRVIATSNDGCTDTAYVAIKVPPYNDYLSTVNEVSCAGSDSLYVNFTLYNNFKRGILPKGLQVTFYDADPTTVGANLLLPSFTVPYNINAKQFTFSNLIKKMNYGNLYVVVNDTGTVLPLKLPNTSKLESDYTNNITVFNYKPEIVVLQPADTTVFRKQSFPIIVNTNIYNPASITWVSGLGATLSCTNCINPIVTVLDSSIVQMQTENKYGCLIKGISHVNVFPPDMTVQILGTKCYSNTTTQVTFKICMNNAYDSVYAHLPVSFYDGNPTLGNANLLLPVFYTPMQTADSCSTFIQIVKTPTTNTLFAVVNDKGDNVAVVPNKAYTETNYINDTTQFAIVPFKVTIAPADTSVLRFENVLLVVTAKGGIMSSYLWTPSQFLSCTNCASPTVVPPHTIQYQLVTQNEYYCIDTASNIVRTFTDGIINIPNAFTPNADGKNDIFYILAGKEVTTIKDFSVFDRWGKKMFQVQNVWPNDPTFGWNGTYNGKEVEPGAYVYFIDLVFADSTRKTYKGTVLVIR